MKPPSEPRRHIWTMTATMTRSAPIAMARHRRRARGALMEPLKTPGRVYANRAISVIRRGCLASPAVSPAAPASTAHGQLIVLLLRARVNAYTARALGSIVNLVGLLPSMLIND